MKFLSYEKISDHRYKTPEGYLICLDSVLARTGKQTYMRKEVFGDSCDNANEEIAIDRYPEEVFSEKTLASFENKPLTNDHPQEDVTIENHNDYAVGFVRDIKRGKTASGEDVMLGTLVVTDADAIEDIENGKTDLSCGYDCDILDEDNPQQRNIRGNHVALCQQGRAGIAHIVDSVDKARVSDVNPRKGESKEDFISRFMSETKSEYPDEKQRLAVAYSYWNKRKTRDISRANEAFATREIKRLEQKIRDIEFELRALQKEDLRYGSAKSTDRRQALLKTQLKEAQNKLADYKRRFPECCDSLKRFEIEFTDSKGRNVIRIVRAKSIEEVFDKYYNG